MPWKRRAAAWDGTEIQPCPATTTPEAPSAQRIVVSGREFGCEAVPPMGSLWRPCKEHPSP
ncbi:DUF3721 domain-containing protein [Synechococcus sp. CS-1332]|nr:DUF3721 domain-containing protein [Synechococcus sp. CS-1332]